MRKSETISDVPEVWKDALYPYPTSHTLQVAEPQAVPLRQFQCRTSAMYSQCPWPRLQYWCSDRPRTSAGNTFIHCRAMGFHVRKPNTFGINKAGFEKDLLEAIRS